MQEIDTPNIAADSPPLAHRASSLPDARSESSCANRSPAAGQSYSPHALTLLASALLAACGGGGSGGSADDGSLPSAPGFNNFPKAANDNEASRFLLQAQFAAKPADVSTVRAGSFASYLKQEFAKPINTAWDWLESRGYGANGSVDKNVYNSNIGDYMVWRDLMSAPDVLRKRVALALSEFFVVSLNSMEIDWRGYTIAAYWDVLNKHAFGNFRDLLEDITLNPAMGYYLNTRGNQKEDNRGRLPDENYAREVMQLFTIGLYELNLDGTAKIDAAGKKIESYDSDDVSQLARIFTGYNFDPAYSPSSPNGIQFPGQNYKIWSREYARRPMTLDATRHSTLAASFLGINVPARPGGTGGAAALKTALDGLFNHPNVGPFFGRQMIQRLVTSNPSPEYVTRVASAFNNNGAGVRGDMKAVWVAILLDDEARGSQGLGNPEFGKLREPMLRFVNWARSFGVVSKAGSWKLGDLSNASNGLGQSPLHSPSVFNFFRPGYVPPGTALATKQSTAPEFQLVNETTVGGYVNYMQNRIRSGIRVNNATSPDGDFVANTDTTDFEGDYTALLALINNSTSTDAESQRVAQSLVSYLNTLLCAGQLGGNNVAEITNALRAAMMQSNRRVTNANTTQMDGYRRDLIACAILMVMASPEYLIQK
ncbi:DUF1800 domain-containing protein [Variovorax sp. PCZ-1]|uniref:DUF1800 domain-containing protein n=1 Tax=Variovorax sp. PCZ-1 TaxID=2835533 RepID=UPI001BCF2500|nr:DUF1800 domain-containing protein [Variovorax sp. PCZ-1]MBS7809019.1 DUF1800 domain-containing protein [Variovorax sp. PCZ-1]